MQAALRLGASPISHEAQEPGAAEIRRRVAHILRRILGATTNQPSLSRAGNSIEIILGWLDGGVGF